MMAQKIIRNWLAVGIQSQMGHLIDSSCCMDSQICNLRLVPSILPLKTHYVKAQNHAELHCDGTHKLDHEGWARV